MEQGPGDDRPLDLRGAFVDAGGAHLPVEVLERVAGDEGAGAENLDGGVNDALNLDSHGKALSFLLLELPLILPASLVPLLKNPH